MVKVVNDSKPSDNYSSEKICLVMSYLGYTVNFSLVHTLKEFRVGKSLLYLVKTIGKTVLNYQKYQKLVLDIFLRHLN